MCVAVQRLVSSSFKGDSKKIDFSKFVFGSANLTLKFPS